MSDVHSRHCCPHHGCKYSDKDCTVESGEYPGIVCDTCDMMREETENLTEGDLTRMVNNMTEMQCLILSKLLEETRNERLQQNASVLAETD